MHIFSHRDYAIALYYDSTLKHEITFCFLLLHKLNYPQREYIPLWTIGTVNSIVIGLIDIFFMVQMLD